jgi:hypothetical protein
VQGFFDAGRWKTYVSTVEILKDYPWLGSGLGTFRWAFPGYRSGEMGLGTSSQFGPRNCRRNGHPVHRSFRARLAHCLDRARPTNGGGQRDAIFPTTAFWTGLLALMRSQVDFPLQIPGFALTVCPVLGMGMAQSLPRTAER